VKIDLSPEDVAKCIDEVGLGFLFAPKLHPAMKYAIGPRREIGVRTVFNILGPLTNPAGAAYQIMGVYDESLVEKLANVLKHLGVKRGFVVSSHDGLDEISISAPTLVAHINNGDIKIKKFKDISCTIIETLQQKECTIKGEMELLSAYPKQLLNKVPVAATTPFEHLSARAIGALNALKPETKKIIQVKPVPFPDDFGMIYDCTETLKLSIQDAIKSNRTFIK
jgi:anthranilate phosphoribosyltransferase